MNWLILFLVIIGVVCVLGGGNDKRNALSVIEGAFLHTVEPDSSAFYKEVSTPVSLGQTNARVERNDQRAESLYRASSRASTANGVAIRTSIPKRNVTPLMKKKVAAKQGWKCACGCGKALSFDFHVDHIVPLWQHKDSGGLALDPNRESNLQALNPACHLTKSAREAQVR